MQHSHETIKASEINPAVPLATELAAQTLLSEQFTKRQEQATELGRVLTEIKFSAGLNAGIRDLGQGIFDDLVSVYQSLVKKYPDMFPAADGLTVFRDELDAQIQTLSQSEEFKKALELSFAVLIPSHRDFGVKSPTSQMSETFERLVPVSDQMPHVREFVAGVLSDLSEVHLKYRKLFQFEQYTNEKILDYLTDNSLEVTQSNVLAAIRNCFQDRVEFERHNSLIESTAIIASKELSTLICKRFSILINQTEKELCQSGFLPENSSRDSQQINYGELISEHLQRFMSDLNKRLLDMRKSINRAVSKMVFEGLGD